MKLLEEKIADNHLETTYTFPRIEAQKINREYFDRSPKGSYDTHVSSQYIIADS